MIVVVCVCLCSVLLLSDLLVHLFGWVAGWLVVCVFAVVLVFGCFSFFGAELVRLRVCAFVCVSMLVHPSVSGFLLVFYRCAGVCLFVWFVGRLIGSFLFLLLIFVWLFVCVVARLVIGYFVYVFVCAVVCWCSCLIGRPFVRLRGCFHSGLCVCVVVCCCCCLFLSLCVVM